MLRVSFFLLFFLLIRISASSQAVEGQLDFQKTHQPVAKIELPCTEDVADMAIKDYMAKKGVKNSSYKGFIVFRSTMLDSADTDLSDLYFMIDRKSRQQKDICVINLLTTKRNQEILARSLTDSLKTESAKSFLNNLGPYIEAYNINVQLNNQDAIVKRAQKKMNALMDDENDLNKRIRKLQASLDENKKDQLTQVQLVEASLKGTDNDKKKAQKKMNSLMDDQGDLEKKLRKSLASLEQNKKDQETEQQEIDKEKQVLDVIKAKQKK